MEVERLDLVVLLRGHGEDGVEEEEEHDEGEGADGDEDGGLLSGALLERLPVTRTRPPIIRMDGRSETRFWNERAKRQKVLLIFSSLMRWFMDQNFQ